MNRKAHRTANLFDWTFVRDALKRAMSSGTKQVLSPGPTKESLDLEISVLINDIFGGEILEARNNKGRHFYNRVNGECIDIDEEEIYNSSDVINVADIPVSRSDKPLDFKREEYSDFFLRFIRAFEETVGLEDNYQTA
jgi:hypothetical protein